jgi:hypothetical protein
MNELPFDHQAGGEVGLDRGRSFRELAIAERNELGRDNAHSEHQEDPNIATGRSRPNGPCPADIITTSSDST